MIICRPAPAATFSPAWPSSRWEEASLSYNRENGWRGSAPEDWTLRMGSAVLHLRPGPGGQIGVFPEHLEVVIRLEEILSQTPSPAGGWRVLNLFAHTGLATLRLAALANVGEIVHLDAAPAAIATAKTNAKASGLATARIRWIADDALAFLARESRRGRDYHLILADPPAFGRNRKSGREWRLERDLLGLFELSRSLANPHSFVFCLACHEQGWDGKHLRERIRKAAAPGLSWMEGMDLALHPLSRGHELPCGCAVIASARC